MDNKKILKLLEESEHFTQMLISIIDEGVIVCDHDFQIQIWNNFIEEMTGQNAEQLHNQWMLNLLPAFAEANNKELLQRGLMGETVLVTDFPYQKAGTGTLRWYRGKISPYIGTNGENLGIFFILKNISNEKKAEETQIQLINALQDQRMLSEALGRIIFANTISTNLFSLLELICQESAFLFSAFSVQVWLLKGDSLFKIAEYGTTSENHPPSRVTSCDPQWIAAKVVESKMPSLINCPTSDEEIHQQGLSTPHPASSIMAVPLVKGEQVIGSLIIENHPYHQFNTADLEIALQFGGYAAIAVESARLYEGILNANEKLIQTYDSTLAGWAKALELRDRETEGHTQRVTNGTMTLARSLSINEESLVHIYRGALLHDIGKMGIPDNILRKPGHLSEEEWQIMRLHPVYAYEWLNPIEYLQPALEIPYCHHEKWDGTGYPRGLHGPDIPLAARIFSVVDVWDALSFDRPYRKAWSQAHVREYIRAHAGSHFDPEIVAKFLEIYEYL